MDVDPTCGCPVEVVALGRAQRRRAARNGAQPSFAVLHKPGCPFGSSGWRSVGGKAARLSRRWR